MAKMSRKKAREAIASRMVLFDPNQSSHEMSKEAKTVVKKAFEQQKKAKTNVLPAMAAELVLSESVPFLPTGPEGYLQYLIAEGVTTKDIESWWNQPDIFRWLDVVFDEWRFLTYFLIYLQRCGNLDEAWWRVYREQPCFWYGPPVEHERLNDVAPFLLTP